MTRLRAVALGALLGATPSCGSEDSGADTGLACADQPDVTWTNFGHAFVTTYCLSCHSVQNTEHRYGAPEGIDFDTEADVDRQADRIRARVLDDGTMPIGGGVYEADLELLDVYLTCSLGN